MTRPTGAAPATLFTAAGKMPATIDALDAVRATLATGDGWAEGSIALLCRHGLRVFGILSRDGDGVARMTFDEPLGDAQRERLLFGARAPRPAHSPELIAA